MWILYNDMAAWRLGSISAALSCLVYPPREAVSSGRSAGSFPEQRLVIEPTWRRKTLGNILWKLEPRRRTALKRSVYDSKLFRKVRILEYRTNVNGNGSSVTIYRDYRKVSFTWLLMALKLIMTTCWQLPIRDNLFIKSFFLYNFV